MLKIYTKSKNGYCILAKQYLDENNIKYREINLSLKKNEKDKKYWKKVGVNTLPIITEDESNWVLPEWDEELFEYLYSLPRGE